MFLANGQRTKYLIELFLCLFLDTLLTNSVP